MYDPALEIDCSGQLSAQACAHEDLDNPVCQEIWRDGMRPACTGRRSRPASARHVHTFILGADIGIIPLA
jgi:hypothetical protein